jgi:hypothetical protein
VLGERAVDFDGTLVVENSTRLLEREMFAAYRGRSRRVLAWLFFGGGSAYVTGLSSVIGRVVGRRIDWRFVLFLLVTRGRFTQDVGPMCDAVAARLRLNTRLRGVVTSEGRLMIVSCGCGPVIERFIGCSGIDAVVVDASDLWQGRSGRVSARLREPRDKVAALLTIRAREYVTDSLGEARLVARNVERSGVVGVNVEEVNGLYRVAVMSGGLPSGG